MALEQQVGPAQTQPWARAPLQPSPGCSALPQLPWECRASCKGPVCAAALQGTGVCPVSALHLAQVTTECSTSAPGDPTVSSSCCC